MHTPKKLQKGDVISLVAPAKAIEKQFIDHATKFWEEKGFSVKVGEHCLGRTNYFSGTDVERAADLQAAIDDPEVRAIICARGGYGCVRIIDHVNWAALLNDPKWLIGFSDVTYFHHHLATLDIPSIHATMPLNYKENTPQSLDSLTTVLASNAIQYDWESGTSFSKDGFTNGTLIGGNLAVISAMIGTDLLPSYENKILFIEDVGEHLYAIDRMFYQLSKSGVLNRISGLIVGGFSNTKDTDTPFGASLEELITAHFKFRNIPIAFNFPAGHQEDNRALIFGMPTELKVTNGTATLKINKG